MKRYKSKRGVKRQQERELNRIEKFRAQLEEAFWNLVTLTDYSYQDCYGYLVSNWENKKWDTELVVPNKDWPHQYFPVEVGYTPRLFRVSFWLPSYMIAP